MKNLTAKKESGAFQDAAFPLTTGQFWLAQQTHYIQPSTNFSIAYFLALSISGYARTFKPQPRLKKALKSWVPAGAGFEPASLQLTAERSTVELPGKSYLLIRLKPEKSSNRSSARPLSQTKSGGGIPSFIFGQKCRFQVCWRAATKESNHDL